MGLPERENHLQKIWRCFRFAIKILFWTGTGGSICALLFWVIVSRGEWISSRLFSAAEEKWRQEDYLGAIHDYERIIERHPKSDSVSEAYYSKGVISFLYLDDPKTAAASFEKFLAKASHKTNTEHLLFSRKYLAEIYEKKLKRPIEAIAVYEAMIAASSDQEEIAQNRYHIGELYYAMGGMAQARVEWDLLVQNNPESRLVPAALYRKGGTYFVTKNCKEAVAVYKKLYEAYPDDEMGRFGKFRAANCLEMNRQPKEALLLYQALEGHYPDPDLISRKMASLEQLIASR